MTIPVLLVTGFLGAGKTTFINRLLHADHGERIAAIVNDFGAINVDASLLEGAADTVIGLQNGCICCSIQGDLLRTLKLLMAREPRPERIVIEASGAADPRGIIEGLTDAVLWNAVRLDAVACLVDTDALRHSPDLRRDELWQAQWRHSDFVLLSKMGAGECPTAEFRALGKPVYDLDVADLPLAAVLGRTGTRPAPAAERVHADRFISIEWSCEAPVPLAAFRDVLTGISKGLVRAKGYLAFVERPGKPHLLQLVGRRVELSAAPDAAPGCRIVLIGERDTFDATLAATRLAGLAAIDPAFQRES